MLKNWYRFLSPRFQNLFLDYPVDMKPRYGHGKPPHAGLASIIIQNETAYVALLQEVLALKDQFISIKRAGAESDSTRPVWNNGFLPGLDILILYTMIARYKPARYTEVGSGNSTKIAHLARTAHQTGTYITSIDPQPRAEIDALVDKVVRRPFEDLSGEFISELRSGDILFIDNSHRILPNSDAMVFFMEVMPALAPGVIVHVHDIYLPYDYPPFMCDRAYSEQYGLAIMLLSNPEKYEVLAPNYFISEHPALASILDPIWHHSSLEGVERHGGSFWFRVS